MIHSIFSGLLDLLAPLSCAACTSLIDVPGEPFCSACEPLVERWSGHHTHFSGLFHYGGPVADAIQRLKYEGRSDIVQALAPELREAAAQLPYRFDAVVAVPLSKAKLRRRGYNQSSLLALQLARALGVPFRPLWIERVRESGRQVGQERAARLRQVNDAFRGHAQVQGKTLLLVDDVRTTGATLDAATRALLDAGARLIHQFALAVADDLDRSAL